jgi:hypothetical protein
VNDPTLDPFGQPGRGGPARLTDVQPMGSQVIVNPDGTSTVIGPNDMGPAGAAHFDNLAGVMDQARIDSLCSDLLEAIEQDKESRAERDRQYEEGLNRTGMGSNVVGGANFPGASRAVHPMLLEAAIDFGGGVMNEMLPPDGPVQVAIVGDESDAKTERAKRVARYMNWQMTEQMTSLYHEFEVGFTQCPLGGAFYTKGYQENGIPAASFIAIDDVYRPWNDGDFYSQPRITHRQLVDRWTYRTNISSGLWLDVVDPSGIGSDIPEESAASTANDRIIGRSLPTENVDGIREVYECSCVIPLEEDEDPLEPYLVTIDVEARKILSIYRNWKENDKNKQRLLFLIEWPFWPWRGGYPVGMTHMIGSLTGAATGTLRALLDAAMLQTTQTGVRLKGGSTAGGQTIRPQVTEITEIQGSLAQDDIRKTFMPLQFNEPSPTLFNLLGFLVDAGRGVVRTTFDEYDKINGQTPVGTAQMFIEQGLKNFGSVHARLHRSMRLFLKWLYQLNAETLTVQDIVDQQGELTVTPQDFQGPMVVIPVSDPRIFSDLQRKAMAQTIAQRAQMMQGAGIMVYNVRATEENFLRQYGVTNPDKYLVPNPIPQRQNAVAENVTASTGGVLKAFPGQDHEAHIRIHYNYLNDPNFGSNPAIAVAFIPKITQHLGEHIALWYSDAMLEAATAALRQQTGNPNIMLDSFMNEGVEVPLDRLMAHLDEDVLKLAQEKMPDVPQIIMQARDLLKRLAPPQPMDPSVVAADDVQRQREADQMNAQTKIIDLKERREARISKDALAEKQAALKAGQDAQQGHQQGQESAMRLMLDARRQEQDAENAEQDRASREYIAEENNETKLEIAHAGHESSEHIAEAGHESAEHIAEASHDSAEQIAKMRPKPAAGGGE